MVRVLSNVKGLDRLRARLAALPVAATQGARSGLHEVAAGAAEDVRRGLREAQASAVSVEPTDKGVLLIVDLPFAADIEFGTARMAAHPIVRPAVAHAEGGAAGVLAAHLDRAVKGRGR